MAVQIRQYGRNFQDAEYQAFVDRHAERLALVDKNAFPSDMRGWMHTEENASPEIKGEIQALAKEIRENAEVFVVVGLGGSNQGARAVIDALASAEEKGGPEIIYAGLNLSGASYKKIINHIHGKSVYINIIAKNFKTLEPGLTFRMLREYMESRYDKAEAARRIITTATFGDGALHRISEEEGYRCLPFPEAVGGRYSVFTPVGLLPIAVAGIDIEAFLAGAKKAQDSYFSGGETQKAAREYAIARNLLMEKGYGIEVLAFFEPQLESFGRWWRQLFGESEGKNHTGLFPAVCSYTEDLHSVGQYMQQGKRQMIETFLHVATPPEDLPVYQDTIIQDGFAYLDGKTYHEINQCAYQATLAAHSSGGVPCMVLEIPALTAENIGELLYFFLIACYYSAVLLDVDPFDQPGVENYKTEMFRLLGTDQRDA